MLLNKKLSDKKFSGRGSSNGLVPNNEAHLSGDGLLDTSSGKRGRNEDGGSCGTGLLHGIANVGENGTVKVRGAGLLGVGTTDDICACPV